MTIYDIYTKEEVGKLLIEARVLLEKEYQGEATVKKLFTDYVKLIGSRNTESIPTSFLFQTVVDKQMMNKLQAYNTCFDLVLAKVGEDYKGLKYGAYGMKLIANSVEVTPDDTFSYFYGQTKIKYKDFMALPLKSNSSEFNLESSSLNEYGAYILTKKLMNQGTFLADECPDLGLNKDSRHVYDVKEYQAIEEKVITKRLQDLYSHKVNRKRK